MDIIKGKNECDYIVCKERRQVICIMNDTRHKLLDYLGAINMDCGVWTREFNMPKQFIGIATCAEGDEWNEQLGKDIAYSKAVTKFNKSFFKRAQAFINMKDKELDRVADEINRYGLKVTRCENSRRNWINNRIEQNTK